MSNLKIEDKILINDMRKKIATQHMMDLENIKVTIGTLMSSLYWKKRELEKILHLEQLDELIKEIEKINLKNVLTVKEEHFLHGINLGRSEKNKFNYIATDKDGQVFLYISKPYKDFEDEKWDSAREFFAVSEENFFKSIKWTDEEPTLIADLLHLNRK